MARKQRIHYEGALYHVICRGNNKAYVFDNDETKQNYLDIVKHYKTKFGFNLYCYCIMDNHIHMLIEVATTPLSQIMKCIQQVYTQRYNKSNNRSGHVFEQRYKSILCDKNQYLLGLINYIHMNPVRADLENGINYKWSSHRDYIRGSSNIVDFNFPLSLFEGTREQQIERYLNYMKFEDDEIGTMKAFEFSDDMADLVKGKLNVKKSDKKVMFTTKEILEKICSFYKIKEDSLKVRTKKVHVVHIKRVCVNLIKDHIELSNREIAEILNMSSTAVSVAINDDIIRKSLEEDIERIGKSGA